FSHFRRQFFATITPELIHLFDSRRAAFEDAQVLQENIILAGVKKGMASVDPPSVIISRSRGLDDLPHPLIQQAPRRFIIDDKQKDPVLHLPVSDIDTHLLQAFRRWNAILATYGLEISTGPVVPFRSSDMLASVDKVKQGEAVPLLWLQHVHRMSIEWPLENFDKPQGVLCQAGQKLFVKNATQIILRRFSTKEEPRRITAAILPDRAFGTEQIALENHLNYLYRPGGPLSYEEAVGIAAFLNSTLVDRYFRITNGNTQVNATELRKLPLPPWERLTRIGERVAALEEGHDHELLFSRGFQGASQAPWRGVGCPHPHPLIQPPKAAQKERDLNSYDQDAIEQIVMEELREDLHFRIPKSQKDNEINDKN
ncbi:MAG TPA: hypothetical protein VEL31_12865, partial [Ktedonobacteraceae bacterium]|nr:hypothetical protein [Ktedonobacteraceae bacterium]